MDWGASLGQFPREVLLTTNCYTYNLLHSLVFAPQQCSAIAETTLMTLTMTPQETNYTKVSQKTLVIWVAEDEKRKPMLCKYFEFFGSSIILEDLRICVQLIPIKHGICMSWRKQMFQYISQFAS